MFWPFKRKPKQEPPAPDMYDAAAQKLIDQGIDPEKVLRATRMVKRYAREGVLPDGAVQPPDD